MRIGVVAWGALLLPALAAAERLPLKSYDTTDGLPSTFVLKIVRDSRGFLWFATRDGLARFDGSRFVTYGPGSCPAIPTVNHALEARDGAYWIATNGAGICRLGPDSPLPQAPGDHRDVRVYRLGDDLADRVNMLHEDRSGRLWAGTDGGLFVLEDLRRGTAFRREELPGAAGSQELDSVRALIGVGQVGP